MPVSKIVSEISRDLSFYLQKKVIATGLHALAHILGTTSIVVAQLMFIVHDWFICMPDFSCCMDKILSRILINFCPASATSQ